MVDPDLTMPNDRLSGPVRHWLQPGITFNAGESAEEGWVGKVTESAVTEYLECAPGPPVSPTFLFRVMLRGSIERVRRLRICAVEETEGSRERGGCVAWFRKAW